MALLELVHPTVETTTRFLDQECEASVTEFLRDPGSHEAEVGDRHRKRVTDINPALPILLRESDSDYRLQGATDLKASASTTKLALH